MEVKDLVGVAVAHRMFGQGIVEDAHDNYIEVFFSQKGKKSKFSYPSCFQGYLTLLEEEKKADVEADLVIWRVESGAEQKEELKQQYLKTQQAIMERREAAERKKLLAAQRSMNRSQYNMQKNNDKK